MVLSEYLIPSPTVYLWTTGSAPSLLGNGKIPEQRRLRSPHRVGTRQHRACFGSPVASSGVYKLWPLDRFNTDWNEKDIEMSFDCLVSFLFWHDMPLALTVVTAFWIQVDALDTTRPRPWGVRYSRWSGRRDGKYHQWGTAGTKQVMESVPKRNGVSSNIFFYIYLS